MWKYLLAAIFLFPCSADKSLAQQDANKTPTASEQSRIVELRADVEKLRDSVSKTREELAELRPVSTVTNTVFYFVAGLSALLGFFGWRKFSDLDTLVGEQVKLQLPRDKREFAEFEEMTNAAEELSRKLKAVTADYEAALSNVKYLDVFRDDFDIEGKLHILAEESTDRLARTRDKKGDGYEGTIFETSWRTSAIAVLSRLPEILKKRNLDANMLFNAAQICRRMQQLEIAQQLTLTAYEKDPSAANKALMLSSVVKGEVGEASEKAFAELMDFITHLPKDSPHIVLAEAWNAAVDQARYHSLVEAIDGLCNRQSSDPSVFVPSYAHAIRAQSIMSDSRPGALERARDALDMAKNLLLQETTESSWFDSALNEIEKCEQQLARSEQMHHVIAESLSAVSKPVEAREG